MANSIIIPRDKSKELCSQTFTAADEHIMRVGVEQSAVALTLFVSSLAAGSNIYMKVYHAGNHEDDKVLIHESPFFDNATDTPYAFEVEVHGPLLIEVFTTGAASFVIRGKAISAHAADVQVVSTTSDDVQKIWRKDMLQQMQENNELLQKLLNHLRVMTDINADEGEDY